MFPRSTGAYFIPALGTLGCQNAKYVCPGNAEKSCGGELQNVEFHFTCGGELDAFCPPVLLLPATRRAVSPEIFFFDWYAVVPVAKHASC